jgi:hypothetical protein
MEASAPKDFMGKSKTKDLDQKVVTDLGEDSWLSSVSHSNDGNSVSLIDKTGKRRCLTILQSEPVESGKSEPVESGNYPAARTLMTSYCTICPYCKCLKIVIDGQIIYYDPIKKQRCGHTWCHH